MNTNMKSRLLSIAIIFLIFFQIEEWEATNLNCGRRFPQYNPLITAIYYFGKPQETVTVELQATDVYACGGTLITSNTVLTAAHCVCNFNQQGMEPENVIVLLGKLNLNVTENSSQYFKIDVYFCRAFHFCLIIYRIYYIRQNQQTLFGKTL